MATKSERLADRAEKARTKEIKKSSSKIKKQAYKDVESYKKAGEKAEAKGKRIQNRDTKEVAKAQKKVDREGTTRLDRKIARLENRKKSKDTKKKTKTAEATAKDLDYTDKKATRQRNRDVASDNRQGRRKAGRAAKKKAMEDFSPATQKGYVYSEKEMKEGRKRAYLAEQAAKDKKQKKADITEMDMDQAKMKAYKEAHPDKYKNAADSPAKQTGKGRSKKEQEKYDLFIKNPAKPPSDNKKAYKKLTKATNKIGEGSDKKDVRQAKKMVKMEEKIDNSPAKMYEGDMHSFDQMDSKNAMATAGESPINYFRQKINYDYKKAENKSLPAKERLHYLENARHDKDSSMAHKHGAMKGDQSASHIDYANYKGTDKGYHGKTGSSHGDQSATHRDYEGGKKKGDGSILSKHFKNR